MSRPGAKRKFRGMVPGRANVRPVADDQMAALQPHRRGLPEAVRLDPEADTPLGRMYLSGQLNDSSDREQGWKRNQAGQRYRTIAKAYLASIGSPKDCLPGGKGYPCKGDPQCGQDASGPPCECKRRKDAYDNAFHALAEAGHRAQVEVAHVAVHDRSCGQIFYLLRGLDALVRQLLTSSRKYV